MRITHSQRLLTSNSPQTWIQTIISYKTQNNTNKSREKTRQCTNLSNIIDGRPRHEYN